MCPPPGGWSDLSTGPQSVHSQGPPPTSLAATTQIPEINTNNNDDLSVTEIKILKNKLIKDNNLDTLMALENKNESTLEHTIEARLEKNDLVQESPGEKINLSHLPQATKQDLNELINNYKEAFSKWKFDIGITLDVEEGAVGGKVKEDDHSWK